MRAKVMEDYNRLNMPTFIPNKINVSIGNPLGGHDQRDQNDLTKPRGLNMVKKIRKKRPMIHGKDKYKAEALEKTSWQMTKAEYVKKGMSYNRKHNIVGARRFGGAQGLKAEEEKFHRLLVKDAFEKGKPIPPEVLAEYPDLTKTETLGTPIGGAGHPIHAFSGSPGGYDPKYDVVKDNSSVAKSSKSTGKRGKINPKQSKYLKNKTETIPINKSQKIISLYEEVTWQK